MSVMQKPVAEETVVGVSRPSLAGHLQIARFDHWVKNVFVLPGIIVALGFDERHHKGAAVSAPADDAWLP